ncbi:MAG: MoaD/ThiS family protein [Bacteroidia bacterium]|nr:MoaD/ThiS family protein [Bacteroidia bacterium]
MIKVLAFGIVAEKIQSNEFYLENIANTQELRSVLLEKFPKLGDIRFTFSINRKLVHELTAIEPNSEIGLLPPFSGG